MRNQDKLLQSERASATARPSVLADPALSDRERCLPGNRSFGIHAAPRQGESPNPRSVLIDQAYDEYCEGYEAGQDQDVDAFCARFPRFKTSLRKLIVAHDLLEAHEEYMEDGKSTPRLAEDLCLGLQDDDKTPWPAPGQTFLGFELLEEIGRGAFARVFLATEPALGNREVAVKISRGGSAEAKTLGRLNHPNIVPVHSVREDRSTGLTLVCMPYLGCATLGDVFDYVFEKGSPPAAARIIGDAVEDVVLLHQPPLDLRMVRGPWSRGHY